MQSKTRLADPAPESAPSPPSAALDLPFTENLLAVMASARRRASRDGCPQADTAHLLHSLLESDPLARAAFDPAQIARLLGYLVQRSIGFGLQWQSSIEAPGDTVAADRERGEQAAAGQTGQPETMDAAQVPRGQSAETGFGAGSRARERWSPAAAGALERAIVRARDRGRRRADGGDLLATLVVDSDSRAVQVLRSAGVDVAGTLAALPA